MTCQIAQIKEIFCQDGVLSQHISGFSPRAVQIDMAIAVSQALDGAQVLVTEAGTGIGKTYAYLVPSLVSGKKVIVSTGTKNLQDQLFYRDLPVIRKALGRPIKVALLKGRGNYLCLHRLNTFLQTDFISNDTYNDLVRVKQWADLTKEGEIEQMPGQKPDSYIMPYITSTADNCLGQDCEFASKCFLLKARRQAQEADLLIVNHHLFFADSQLKDFGINDLLPDSHAVIFDEAHQLHEIATHFLGMSISGRQLTYLARDVNAEQQANAPDMTTLKQESVALIQATGQLQSAFGHLVRGSWDHIVHKPEIKQAIEQVIKTLNRLQGILEIAAPRARGLENCWKRAVDLSQLFLQLTKPVHDNNIHWYEVHQQNFSIHQTPVSIKSFFQRLIEDSAKAWVFTSATLSIGGDFRHFEEQLGLPNAKRLYLESPFDYRTQAILYTPPIQHMPNDEHYLSELIDFAIPILQLTKGRAFFLFTSHRALKEAATYLERRVDFPLLVQGTKSKTQLLSEFCSLQDGILLGTSSFWEGVDVKGNQLACVIIDKIPFLTPDDPILKHRFEFIKRQGGNPFREYQLPHAVITLRQGAGRLIRDIDDKGILMICDPRLNSKDYGKVFLESLPPMPMTHELEDVVTFFEKEKP